MCIDTGLARLRDLVFSLDEVHSPVFDESRAGLLEIKRRVRPDALFSCVQDPVIMTRTGVVAGFASADDALDLSGS